MVVRIWLLLVGVTLLPSAVHSSDLAPVIIDPPVSQVSLLHDTVNLTCLADGKPTPTYQWFFNNAEIEGENLPNLVIHFIRPEHRGVYHCMATNTAGSDVSEKVQVTIKDVRQYTMTLEVQSYTDIFGFLHSLPLAPAWDNGITIVDAKLRAESILVTLNASGGEFPTEGLTTSLQASANGIAQRFGIIVTGVQRFDGCPSEGIDGFTWPESDLDLLGPTIRVSCTCGSLDTTMLKLQAVRNCTGSYTDGAEWMGPGNSTACQFSNVAMNLCSLYDVKPEDAVHYYLNLTESEIDATVAALSIIILSQNITATTMSSEKMLGAVNVISTVQKLNHSLLEHIQDLLHDDTSMTNQVLTIVDAVTNDLLTECDRMMSMSLTVMADDHGLAITVMTENASNFQGLSFDVDTNNDGSINGINTSPFASNSSSISIPETLFMDLGINPPTNIKAAVTVFENGNLFPDPEPRSLDGTSIIASHVVSVDVPGVDVYGLSEPFTLTFEIEESKLDSLRSARMLPTCNFIQEEEEIAYSTSGCELIEIVNSTVRCECSHLTTFAILMEASPHEQLSDHEKAHRTFVLEIITYGCLSISIGGLLLTIFTYLLITKLRTSDVGQMLLNLCFALLGLYVAFLISTSADSLAETKPGRKVYGFFSALLHYFMLAYFFWTAAESLFLFVKLFKIHHGRMTTYIYVAMAICWSIPMVIVAISLGGYQYYTSDTFCRPTQWPFWFGFVASFALIYLFNWVMFIITTATLCMYSRRNTVKTAKYTNVYVISIVERHLLVVVILSLLFGLGWAFGLIGTSSQLPEEAYTPAQYIFSIFMGIQGVLIFLLHAVRSREARREWKKWWYTATCRSNTQLHEQKLTGLSFNKKKEMQPMPTIVENVQWHACD